jgi:TatD DNase family protein
MSKELVDIGVNLDHRSFDRDRLEVVRRATASGVKTLVLTGTNLKSSQAVLELCHSLPGNLYCTAGIHPHNARQGNEQTLANLRKLAESPKVVAIGECGLDFNRDFSPRPLQEDWFEAQLQLAGELKLPVFLHERDAHSRFVEIIRMYRDRLTGGVVHCFTGTASELQAYLDLDLHIGITGWICDERRGLHLRELVKHIPLERLMLETDAPFLTPRNIQPKPKEGRNEPVYLSYVARAVAQALKKPVEEVAQATTDTATRFFNLA